MRFGEKLSVLRKQRGMTQMELAEKLEISRQAVSRWEQGTAEPSTENLVRIGKLFGVSVDALVDEELRLQGGPTVQAAEKEGKSNGCLNDHDGASATKRMVAICLVTTIIVLVVFFYCLRTWQISREAQDPISIDEMEQTVLNDTESDSFYMEEIE